MKILVIFGTRPEAIKMAPLIHALRGAKNAKPVVCVTAQHRQMLDQVLRVFEISPDIDLNLMRPGQDLFDVTSSAMLGLRSVIAREKPDMLLVHGDTTTSLAASIAGFYTGTPIGHVEAGLRTFNLMAPFPEEFNRQVVTKLAYWHFAPTESCKKNLLSEGISSSKITVTGNTVIDALFFVLKRLNHDQYLRDEVIRQLNEVLQFNWQEKKFVLITGHRRENFGDGFLSICIALRYLAFTFPNVHFVYPVHLNPNIRKPVHETLGDLENVHLIEPLDYLPFVYLMKNCYLVLTDSGGIQEEAPSLGKPVLVMRDVTERPEALIAGTVRLVGADQNEIISAVSELLTNNQIYLEMSKVLNPYGDGQACIKILHTLGID